MYFFKNNRTERPVTYINMTRIWVKTTFLSLSTEPYIIVWVVEVKVFNVGPRCESNLHAAPLLALDTGFSVSVRQRSWAGLKMVVREEHLCH
jgi:hypothetical protein